MNDPEQDTPGPSVAGSSDAGSADAAGAPAAGADGKRAHIDKARLDRVFGDVFPDTTADERGAGGSRGRSDEDYFADRPPHHGG